MPIRHEDSVDHWHNTSAFPVIFLDKFHSSGNMTHTIYNCFTWFNIYYIHSKRQRNLKDLVSVELKGDKSTEGCQTLENSRKCTKQSYTPYVLSLQIIVQYSKFSRWGTTENRGRELLLGVLSGVSFVQTSEEKDEKAAESPTWLGYQKILLHLCRLGGCSAFLNGAIKNTARQSTIDRAEAALRAQAQCPGGGAAQVRSFQEIITLDIPLDYPRYFLD